MSAEAPHVLYPDEYKDNGNGTFSRRVYLDGVGGGQGFNRELSQAQLAVLSDTDAVRFLYPLGSRPSSIELKPIGGACWVVFDAPDPATALAWLGGASGESVDSQRYLISEYLPEQDVVSGASESGRCFDFTDGLSNMYILEFSATLTALTSEAS